MAKNKKATAKELGGSGTTVYGGVVQNEEYRASLSTEYNGQGLRVFEKMRKSDPVVSSALALVKLGIIQAQWVVTTEDESSQGKEVKEYVEEALFNRMNKSWEKVLEDILTYLDFGFSVFEKVFKMEDDSVWIKKLGFRDQESIVKFETDKEDDGITQQLQGDEAKERGEDQVSIPIEKLLVFTHKKEGKNWRGVSLLRSAYKPWFLKQNVEKVDAIGFERAAVGIPVWSMPENPDEKDSETADELGEELRANEKAYIKLPFGWEFEITQSKYDGKAADQAIQRFNRDIFANMLAQFMVLGQGSTGSRALAQQQQSAFYKSLQATADYVASIVNDHLIKQLVDFNFTVETYPKLEATGIQEIDIEAWSAAIQRLTMSGHITASPELEQFVRAELRLPELIEENLRDEDGESRNGRDVSGEEEEEGVTDRTSKVEAKEKGKTKRFQEKKKDDFWRPLTFAERKVNFKSISRQMDRLEADVVNELPQIASQEIDNLLNTARDALQGKNAKRVENMTIQFKVEIRQKILDFLKNAFETGKISASNEMDVAAPQTDKNMIDQLTTRANAIADKFTQDLLARAKFVTLDHIQQGTPTDDALSSVESELINLTNTSVQLASSVITSGGINQGRLSVFDEFPERIHALQRSEILDSRTCNFCFSLDGRVVERGDKITRQGPFHFNCRGLWVEILREEAELPDITGVPQQLRERVGSISEFRQIPEPIPLSGSLADEFLKNEG